MASFDGIEREIGEKPALSIIWMHGLGADASDFLPIVGELMLPCATRFVFPNAPLQPVTINGGMVMRAWYDIVGFDRDTAADTAGIAASVAVIRELIAREVERGLASEQIVLAGFSQGGAVALHAGLSWPHTLGGIIGLSTYLPAPRQLPDLTSVQQAVPVWLAHGAADAVIPLHFAESSAEYLRKLGLDVAFSTYPMGHEVCMPEIAALNGWLGRFAAD